MTDRLTAEMLAQPKWEYDNDFSTPAWFKGNRDNWGIGIASRHTVVQLEAGDAIRRFAPQRNGGVYVTNFLRYLLEVADSTDDKTGDGTLVLLMRNPSYASKFRPDGKSNLVSQLLDLPSTDQKRYRHILVINLSPVVTSQGARLDGCADDLPEVGRGYQWVPIDEQTATLERLPNSAVTRDVIQQTLQQHHDDRLFERTLEPNYQFICQLLANLQRHQVVADVVVATGDINDVHNQGVVNKAPWRIDLDAKSVEQLMTQYQRVMAALAQYRQSSVGQQGKMYAWAVTESGNGGTVLKQTEDEEANVFIEVEWLSDRKVIQPK